MRETRATIDEAQERADEFCTVHWTDLRDDASRPERTFLLGAIEAFRVVGVFSDEKAELWRRRIETCPGHDDEGGRVWCAYCGVMRGEDFEP